MSKGALRLCQSGKVTYVTEREAREEAKRLRRRPRLPGGKMRPYKCPLCPDWHLTSQEQKSIPKKEPA